MATDRARHRVQQAVSEDFDISAQGDVAKLKKGAIGLGGVLFLTVTGSAPDHGHAPQHPRSWSDQGEGIGTPAAFIVATVVLTHLLRRVRRDVSRKEDHRRRVSTPTISHGLGREIGFRRRVRHGWSPTGSSRHRWAGGLRLLSPNLKLASLGATRRLGTPGPRHGPSSSACSPTSTCRSQPRSWRSGSSPRC